jgi:alpha-glucosidase
LYEDLYNNLNVSGFWNDMNEPAVFQVNSLTFPDDVSHDYDGHPTNHKKAHNIYGMQMARATQEGLKKLKPEKRPFLLTRANFAGGQRYAAVWTGDNVASWNHLKLANTQCQRLSISGFSHCGTDIGGFVDSPNGELMVRWLQLAVFHPLMRVHSMGNHGHGASMIDDDSIKESEKFNRMDQEPWSFGADSTDSSRKAIELRYRILPVVYHAFHRFVNKGIPMMQSMSFAYQSDNQAIAQEFAFMFADFLVYPVMEEAAKNIEIYLPEGNWYNFETATHCLGNQTLGMEVSIDTLPIFVKAGAVVPLHRVRQHTREKVDVLTLQVYAGELEISYESEFYQDMGEGYDDNATCTHHFTQVFDGQSIALTWTVQKGANYVPDYNKIIIEYIIPDRAKTVAEIGIETFMK